MDLHLKNKIALVIGASQGLGLATAKLLAQEGAKVAINSRNLEKLAAAELLIKQTTPSETLIVAGDVTDPSIPQKLMDTVHNKWGGLDILVASAGGPPPGPFESFDDSAWQKAFELSFMSQVRLIRAALPLLSQSSAASVLTITSISVKQPIVNMVFSNSLRAATTGLTKTLALELGHKGIRFNAILPSWTETERVTELLTDRSKRNNTSLEQEIHKQSNDSPLGRMGKPEEFANAAVFLVSPAASYLTGVMLNFDGGSYKGTF